MIDLDKIQIWKDNINSFVVVDYNTIEGPKTAKGKLESVSDDGKITIRHVHDKFTFWSIKINSIENFKFSPLRGED